MNLPYSFGGEDHRLVAGDVRLRREHVHRLRARDPRQPLEREAGDARAGERLDARGIERIEHADEQRAALQLRELVADRRAHLEHDVGAERLGSAADAGARDCVIRVRDVARDARAGLDDDVVLAARRELLDGLRRGGDAGFSRSRFAWNADQHVVVPCGSTVANADAAAAAAGVRRYRATIRASGPASLELTQRLRAAGAGIAPADRRQIAAAIAMPTSAVVRLAADVGRARRARVGEHALDRARRSRPRPRDGRGSRASARPTRSGRSDWRCPCRRCRAPSRAPARTATDSSRSGLMFAEGAMPIVPHTAGPRSDRMSPNRFEPTTTSKHSRPLHEMRAQDVDVVLVDADVRIVRRHRAGSARPSTAS